MRINITIDKIQDGQAILKDEKGRLIDWPLDLLPAGAKAGDKTAFNIGEEGGLAKNILNEILSVE
jgi:hypothetical protein